MCEKYRNNHLQPRYDPNQAKKTLAEPLLPQNSSEHWKELPWPSWITQDKELPPVIFSRLLWLTAEHPFWIPFAFFFHA